MCWRKEERKDVRRVMVARDWRWRGGDGRQVVNLPFISVLPPIVSHP